MLEKDPAKDRDEFEKRLESIFNPMKGKEMCKCLCAVIQGNQLAIDKAKVFIDSCQLKTDKYLKEWDEASSYKARQAVVGSVRND